MPKLEYQINTEQGSRYLSPKGGVGLVDVVNDFAWTKSPKESRKDVPRVYLEEFQQTSSQLIASIMYYGRVAGGIIDSAVEDGTQGLIQSLTNPANPEDVYKFKYIATPTKWSYSFPFFSKTHTTRNNSFGDENTANPFSSMLNVGSQMLGYGTKKNGLFSTIAQGMAHTTDVAKAVQGLVGMLVPGKISFESPQTWDRTNPESIQVQFHLFNTGSIEDIQNNRNLAHLLRYNNSPSRRNFALVDPPVIYSLYVPDIIELPACYMQTLAISELGNTRLMDLGNGVTHTIPEAYGFNMTFSSLLMPTRNMLQALDRGQTVQAIGDISDMSAIINEIIKKAQEWSGSDPSTNND